MHAAQLLYDVEALSHYERTAHIVTQARELERSDPPAIDALLAELGEGDRYSREVGLLIARHTGRVTVIAGYLDDPDPGLRSIAAGLLPWFAALTPEHAVSLMARASKHERGRFVNAVLRHGRRDLAEALVVGEHSAYRAGIAARLLPLAGEALVTELIDELAPLSTTAVGLARAWPLAFLAHAEHELSALSADSVAKWWQRRSRAVLTAFSMLGPSSLDRVAGLMAEFTPLDGWTKLQSELLNAVTVLDAVRGVELSLRAHGTHWPRHSFSRATLRHIALVAPESALALARVYRLDDPPEFQRLVLAAPPATRGFLTGLLDETPSMRGLSFELNAALPPELRAADARRDVAYFRSEGLALDPVLSRLPFAEAEAPLRELLGSPLPETRAQGYKGLIESAAYTGDAAIVSRVLGSFDRLRNEQEPVRVVALESLARLPMRVLAEDQAQTLRALVADAFGAPDHSYGSESALRTLGLRILRAGTKGEALYSFAIRALTITNPQGVFSLPELAMLSPRIIEDIVAALLPLVDEKIAVRNYTALFSLISALRERAWGVAALDSRLDEVTRLPEASIARQAVPSLLADPRTHVERVRLLVGRDVSVLALFDVGSVAATIATDLLTPEVLRGDIAGKFHTSSEIWMPDTSLARRWTAEQRRTAASHLATFVEREGQRWQDFSFQRQALRGLTTIPEWGPPILTATARSSNDYLARLALTHLGSAPISAGAEEVLTEALRTDRALVAGSALVNSVEYMRPPALEAVIAEALAGPLKVTSRKTLVQAIGCARLADPWPELERILGGSPHRDVVAAVCSIVLRRLDDPRSLSFLAENLAVSQFSVNLIDGIDPLALPKLLRGPFAALLIPLCQSPDTSTSVGGLVAAARWIATSAELREAIWANLVNLGLPAYTGYGRFPVLAMLESDFAEGLLPAIASLLAADSTEHPGVEEPRARRRIEALFVDLPRSSGTPLPETVNAMAAVSALLAGTGDFAVTSTTIALWLLAVADEPMEQGIGRLSGSLAGRPAVALELGAPLMKIAQNNPAEIDRLTASIPLLSGRGAAEALLAATIVREHGSRTKWAPRWRALLATLRECDFADARELARRTVALYN